MEETMIFPILPMSEKETQEVFKEVDPMNIKRFIQTRREEIKEKLISSRTVEDLRYHQGEIAGLEFFMKMAIEVAKKEDRDEKKKVAVISKIKRDSMLGRGKAKRPK